MRGTLALGRLVTGVRAAPPAIPKALARHAAAEEEEPARRERRRQPARRATVKLAEVAGDARAPRTRTSRFGDDARRARDRVLTSGEQEFTRCRAAPDVETALLAQGEGFVEGALVFAEKPHASAIRN